LILYHCTHPFEIDTLIIQQKRYNPFNNKELYLFKFSPGKRTLLIGTEGGEDSCGSSGTGETPQAQPRRLTARPAESEAAWNGNQQTSLM